MLGDNLPLSDTFTTVEMFGDGDKQKKTYVKNIGKLSTNVVTVVDEGGIAQIDENPTWPTPTTLSLVSYTTDGPTATCSMRKHRRDSIRSQTRFKPRGPTREGIP
jgi:hypothetical protein